MRRSSRIQIKHETALSQKCDPISTGNKKNRRQARTRILNRRDSKKTHNPLENKRTTTRNSVITKENVAAEESELSDLKGLVDELIDSSKNQEDKEKASTSGVCYPLVAEESNDSIFLDVENSIKIDRTIKNLSPEKFFLNKRGKTTRSGRSFSPYESTAYSNLFLNFSENVSKEPRDICPGIQNNVKKLTQNRKSEKNTVKDEILEQKRSRKGKTGHGQHKRRSKGCITSSEVPSETLINVLKSPFVANIMEKLDSEADDFFCLAEPLDDIKIEKLDSDAEDLFCLEEEPLDAFNIHKADSEDEDLYCEKSPVPFPFGFLTTSELDGHSLPRDFFSQYEPVATNGAEALSPSCSPLRELGQSELDALSKISLADADKYEFKSVFKDAESVVANFEDHCGLEVPGRDIQKFDIMESEPVEGRRFYRKRISDPSLLEWHKYNVGSSTRYLNDVDPPAHPRPIIKVRSNPCPRADLVWRQNQTQQLPSVEDILGLSTTEESTKTKYIQPECKF